MPRPWFTPMAATPPTPACKCAPYLNPDRWPRPSRGMGQRSGRACAEENGISLLMESRHYRVPTPEVAGPRGRLTPCFLPGRQRGTLHHKGKNNGSKLWILKHKRQLLGPSIESMIAHLVKWNTPPSVISLLRQKLVNKTPTEFFDTPRLEAESFRFQPSWLFRNFIISRAFCISFLFCSFFNNMFGGLTQFWNWVHVQTGGLEKKSLKRTGAKRQNRFHSCQAC